MMQQAVGTGQQFAGDVVGGDRAAIVRNEVVVDVKFGREVVAVATRRWEATVRRYLLPDQVMTLLRYRNGDEVIVRGGKPTSTFTLS